ncbi:MAG: S41 family peptidase [Bacteroidales bacterium]|jgi:carboxyl-terminal processing protease|nr:S41 family peptidase [Bacteroidales bacterium]MDD3702292.1 S41 family peptidase [Bacteroidales bacterium]MDY0369548.1 S41 family peptidase [Bacteroidales bacterium]
MKHKFFLYQPLLLAVVLAAGLYFGYRIANGNRLSERSVFYLPVHKGSKIDNILSYIEQDYVDTITRSMLEDHAIKGMLEKLDPHSQYISPEEFDEMNDPLLGSFEGIGVSFRIEKDTITVINPVKGGPSERVGVMSGDRIVMIDDSLVAGIHITNRDAMRRLKGKKGTKVKVGVFRRGVEGFTELTITRDIIPTFSLDVAYMINKTIGYIRLNKFSATTHQEFIDAASRLKNLGMSKLILDLRGNAGGYLKAATDLADEFLPEGTLIVYTQGKNRSKTYSYASRKGMFEHEDLVVLIDEGSASASEIVAGALQDNDRGTVIGRRSFGKGLVQEQVALPDGSAIRLTVARYYTPTGRSIQRPYDENFKEYHHEPIERFINGELSHSDSIHLTDTVKYITSKGKIVYGGGGIMPDIFVPITTDSTKYFFNRLANSGLIFQVAFDYADTHRQQLQGYGSAEKFIRNFKVNNELLNDLLAFAAEKGIRPKPDEWNGSREATRILLKAYIGRNVFDDDAFYPVYQDIDDTLLEAIHYLYNS